MSRFLRYLGPQSPWGAGVSGVVTPFVLILAIMILGPPVFWASRLVFGWWFNFWL
jgi:hypothetical protein